MKNRPVYVFAKWRIRPGQLENVLILLDELAGKTRAEEGNLAYQVHQSNTDANTLVLYEAYADSDAQQAHIHSPHFQRLAVGKIIPLLADREVVLASLVDL